MENNMSLVEQYGGYGVVKQAISNYKKSGDMVTAAGLELQCLEYRREHNIFEVLDWVVYESKLYQIKYIYHPEKARITDGFQGRTIYDFPLGIRHATDEEIKEGRRL